MKTFVGKDLTLSISTISKTAIATVSGFDNGEGGLSASATIFFVNQYLNKLESCSRLSMFKHLPIGVSESFHFLSVVSTCIEIALLSESQLIN